MTDESSTDDYWKWHAPSVSERRPNLSIVDSVTETKPRHPFWPIKSPSKRTNEKIYEIEAADFSRTKLELMMQIAHALAERKDTRGVWVTCVDPGTKWEKHWVQFVPVKRNEVDIASVLSGLKKILKKPLAVITYPGDRNIDVVPREICTRFAWELDPLPGLQLTAVIK